jgi:thiol-disulfide isomerase/thioredoxin
VGVRPLAPLSCAFLLLLALVAPGCKGGCDQNAAGGAKSGAGGDASLSAPSSPRFGGSNCPGGSCPSSSASSYAAPPSGPGPDPAAVRRLPSFTDRRVADVGGQPAPERVAGRAVVPPGGQGPEQGRTGQEPPPPAHSGVKELRSQAEFDAAKATGTPMIVKWSSASCGPCRRIEAGYVAAARVLDGQVAFYKVDVEQPGAPALPADGGVPQLAFYENRALVTQRVGAFGVPPLNQPAQNEAAGRDWFVAALAERNLQR